MPHRVLTLEALTEAATPAARNAGPDQLIESALQALEDDGWDLVTVGSGADGAPRWYFRQVSEEFRGRMTNMR